MDEPQQQQQQSHNHDHDENKYATMNERKRMMTNSVQNHLDVDPNNHMITQPLEEEENNDRREKINDDDDENNYRNDVSLEKKDSKIRKIEQASSTTTETSSNVSEMAERGKNKVLAMMKRMGWEGEGLGKSNQGSASALDPQVNLGRGGLGLKSSMNHFSETAHGNDHADSNYQLPPNFVIQRHASDDREYSHKENVIWLACKQENRHRYVGTGGLKASQESSESTIDENTEDFDPIYHIVKPISKTLDPSCMEPGTVNEGQNTFTDPEIMKSIFKTKAEFDGLPERFFIDARFRSNPYEKIGKSIFQNRAAVKLANIDMITNLTKDLPRLPEENNVLYFADICAGPGGFTEYLYYRYKTTGAKGWGFTLKNDKDDWKLEKFNRESPHDNFELNYGADGTGDITINENMLALRDAINRGTNNRGVALVTGDGGFCVDGVENSQEYLTQQLVLCQYLTALMCLRKGGSFVCKLFDLNTWFSASLMYILYQHFEQISIIKPFSSRPANSERYVVCKGLLERNPPIIDFLLQVNTKIASKKAIKSLVPCSIMENDKDFADYLTLSNNNFAKDQEYNLKRLKMAVEDRYIEIKELQFKLKELCLKEWNLPNPQHDKRHGNNNYYNNNNRRRFDERGDHKRKYDNYRNDNNYHENRNDGNYNRNRHYNNDRSNYGRDVTNSSDSSNGSRNRNYNNYGRRR